MSSSGDLCENWRDIETVAQDSESLRWNHARNENQDIVRPRYPDQKPNGHNAAVENGESGRTQSTWPDDENEEVISDQKLKEILEKSDLDALTMQKLTSKEFAKLLDKRISTETLCLVISILRKSVSISVDGNTRMKLNRFRCAFLANKLPIFISGLSQHISAEENRDKFLSITEDLLVFIQQFHASSPAATVDIVRNTVISLDAQISFINKRDNCIPDNILDLLTEIKESVENKIDVEEEPPDELGASYVRYVPPPSSFRLMNICPTESDIFDENHTFLQKNIIKGKYVDTEHYLDVQFRLLHEDFVRGLRNGIQEYMMLIKTVDKDNIKKVMDLNVYNNVRIRDSELNGAELVYNVHFDTSQLKNIVWQVRLVYSKFML